MNRRHSALAVLAAGLLLAGCGGFSSAEKTPTLTPAPVPDIPTTATPDPAETLAPGVGEGGVTDPERLANAHADLLGDVSYTVKQTVVHRDADGAVLSRYVTRVQFGAEPGRFSVTRRRFVETGDGVRTRVTRQVGTGRRVYRHGSNRTELVAGTASETREDESRLRSVFSNRDAVAEVFRLVDTEVRGRTVRNGTRYLRVSSEEPASVPPLRNVSVTALVSERGLVRSYRVSYRSGRSERTRRTIVSVTYTDLGTTTVELPAWAEPPPEDG